MILVFGGTTEGRNAALALDTAGVPFYYSTKGSLQEVGLYNGERVCGAMEKDRMEQFCIENGIKLIVDAAHPFAEQLHKTIYEISLKSGIQVIRYERNFGDRNKNVIWCSSYKEAVGRMVSDGVESLLALTGVNTIPKLEGYWKSGERECIFRVLDRDESREKAALAGFPKEKLVFFEYGQERQLIEEINPDAIITKESGDSGYFNEKVNAALDLGIKVYAVMRPQLPESFITVYGPVGLRLEVEKIVPDFFPLRIGLTTGSTATAAVKGALRRLLFGESAESVHITLPSGEKVRMNIKEVWGDSAKAWGCVTKYSGDDPDVTDGHDITCSVSLNDAGCVRFLGGEGVGTVTLPGLGLEVGGPAINNGPRDMIRVAVGEEFARFYGNEVPSGAGVDVTIMVSGGRELAARTFNPRVGVVGGISIIGTSGVVRPFSKEAFLDSISREMDVAKAMGVSHLVINSGARSEIKLKEKMGEGFVPQAFVHYGNFIGDTVRMAYEHGFEALTMGIMIGKAVKLAAGNLDTHSKVVTVDKQFVQEVARKSGCSRIPEDFTLARELWRMFDKEDSAKFFKGILDLCHKHCSPLFPDGKFEILLVEE